MPTHVVRTMARKSTNSNNKDSNTKSCRRITRAHTKHSSPKGLKGAPCKEMNQRATCSTPGQSAAIIPVLVLPDKSSSSSCDSCCSSTVTPRGVGGGGCKAKQQQQRKVRFATKIEVETRYASAEDLKNAWFTGPDYATFEKDCGRTIAAIRRACSLRRDGSPQYRLNAEEFTASGLEDMLTDELKRHRGFLKGRHHHHVLMEQHMQRVHGVVEPEQLQAISQLFSTESCHIALGRGTVKSY